PGDRLPAPRRHADGDGRIVLLRRHLAADRGGRGDGLHCADPGAPDVAPVRQPAEESESEGQQAVMLPTAPGHRPRAKWATRAAVSRTGGPGPIRAPE